MTDAIHEDTTDPTHEDAIDWHSFWNEADERRRKSAHVGQFGHADVLEAFFEHTRRADSLASFGCGPAAPSVELAARHPEMDVFGYDVAPSALEAARERAREMGVENVAFERRTLPAVDVERRFDLVYCYATLHYVDDVETALRNLHERVREDGYLAFNYPNRLTLATYRRMVAGESELSLPGDPEAFRERFGLVFAGRNLLSYDRIHEVLGRWPRSVWSAIDASEDAPWVGPHNPFVYVPGGPR